MTNKADIDAWLDEVLFRLQHKTLSNGYDVNHKLQQVELKQARDSIKQLIDEAVRGARIEELKKAGYNGALESDESIAYYKYRIAQLSKGKL